MKRITHLLTALTITSGLAIPAMAQDSGGDLATSDLGSLRSALEMRYDAALAATRDDGYISANDPRYLWASEAKVQCAIAIGYLKSRTRDETSISKCGMAYDRMMRVPRPAPRVAAPTPQPRPDVCGNRQPGLVFFDFDESVPPSDARQTIEFVTSNASTCGWERFRVVGHTDRAGSNAYNDGLAARRADAVADVMQSMGIDRSRLSVSSEGETNPRVPTEDGVRNPQNRRVEISVSQ